MTASCCIGGAFHHRFHVQPWRGLSERGGAVDRNIGSASAMLGFLQIGVSGLASASVGIFDSHTMMPVALILAATSWIGFAILLVGKRRIHGLRYVEEKGADPLPH